MTTVRAVFGPPGTGKTTHLIGNAQACVKIDGKVLYLSYTKAAATEAAQRAGDKRIEASTLHSLAYRYLNVSRSQVITRDRLKAFGDITGVPIKGVEQNTFEETQVGDEYLAVISYALATRMDVHEAYDRAGRPGSIAQFEMFEQSYREWKKEFGLIDFDDMLVRFAESSGSVPSAPTVILDEAQDCSPLQWEVFGRIARDAKRVIIAGDDDQAIYEWNGADPHGMREFTRRHRGATEILEQSHRVPRDVHTFIDMAITPKFQDRVEKNWRPTDDQGEVVRFGSVWDFDFSTLRGKNAKVLVRDRYNGLVIQRIMNAACVPYRVAGGWSPFYNRKVNAIRAIIKLNRGDVPTEPEFHAMMDMCGRQLGAHPESAVIGQDWRKLVPLGSGDRDFYESVDLDEPLTIELSTIHQAKGKEADVVVVDLSVTGAVLDHAEGNMDAELRVWYVGCSRTRSKLVLCGDNPYV